EPVACGDTTRLTIDSVAGETYSVLVHGPAATAGAFELSVTEEDPDLDGDGDPDATDCDDAQASVHPGADELCDELDNDCDGEVDEGVLDTFYQDADGDGFGDESMEAEGCENPSGYVASSSDCNDGDASAHPGSVEVCDGVDNDCDGEVDEDVSETWYLDADGDGYGDPGFAWTACEAPSGTVVDDTDCDDLDAGVHPGADEVCDEVDNDC
ncbi:MAG: putative metal-binding motif-containing protein, partial [Myxococcota bacterium]|nr:putative metal-binding motif-containing protein [Myxococcota bacterium]